MNPKIALFANKNSKQLFTLRDAVKELGAEPLVFNIQLMGEDKPKISMNGDDLSWNNVNFNDINAIHIRCTALNTLPALPPVLNARSINQYHSDYLLEQELQSSTYAFFERLKAKNKLVINSLTTAYIEHDTKTQLYKKLRANGFDAPDTISTNSPSKAHTFIQKYKNVVIKPAIGVGSTREITEQDIARLEDLRICPAMMQERIIGDTIRVHIIGNKVVLALRIISDDTVDSRTNTENFEYYNFPEDEAEKIIKANKMLGLHYAAWDVQASKDDKRLAYLDCNPGPYIMWIGKENSYAVLKQLASYMIAFAKTSSIEQAELAVTKCKLN